MRTIAKRFKHKNAHRLVAWILTLCMVFTLMPATAWAELTEEDQSVADGTPATYVISLTFDNMKKDESYDAAFQETYGRIYCGVAVGTNNVENAWEELSVSDNTLGNKVEVKYGSDVNSNKKTVTLTYTNDGTNNNKLFLGVVPAENKTVNEELPSGLWCDETFNGESIRAYTPNYTLNNNNGKYEDGFHLEFKDNNGGGNPQNPGNQDDLNCELTFYDIPAESDAAEEIEKLGKIQWTLIDPMESSVSWNDFTEETGTIDDPNFIKQAKDGKLSYDIYGNPDNMDTHPRIFIKLEPADKYTPLYLYYAMAHTDRDTQKVTEDLYMVPANYAGIPNVYDLSGVNMQGTKVTYYVSTSYQLSTGNPPIYELEPDKYCIGLLSPESEALNADNDYAEVYICMGDKNSDQWYNLNCFMKKQNKKGETEYNLRYRVKNNDGSNVEVEYTADQIKNATVCVLSENWYTTSMNWKTVGENTFATEYNKNIEYQGYAGPFVQVQEEGKPLSLQQLKNGTLKIETDHKKIEEIRDGVKNEENEPVIEELKDFYTKIRLEEYLGKQAYESLSPEDIEQYLREHEDLRNSIYQEAEKECMKSQGLKKVRWTEYPLKEFTSANVNKFDERPAPASYDPSTDALVIRLNPHNIGWINGEYESLAPDAGKGQIIHNGKVEFISCTYGDGENVSSGFSGDGYKPEFRSGQIVGGSVGFRAGAVLKLKLVPDYGYQFKDATVNGGIILPAGDEEKDENIFRIQLPNGTFHLGITFGKTENDASTDAAAQAAVGTVAGLSVDNSEGINGNLSLNARKANPTAAETAGMRNALSAGNELINNAVIDMDVLSYTQKGATNGRWERPITDLGNNNVNITIAVSDAVAAAIGDGSCSVVRAHEVNGQKVYKELPAKYDKARKTLTFASNQFSEFAIAAKKTSTDKKEEVTAPQKGTEIKDSASKSTVKVTNPGKVVNGKVVGAEVEYTGPTDSKSTISIPSTIKDEKGNTYTVTAIAPDAFKGNKTVKKVTVPNTVATIGANAFSNCKNLTGVTVGKNIKKIDKNAFSGCKKLKTITIKATRMPTIGKNAFKNISKTATIKVPKKLYKKFKQKLTSKTGFKKTMKLKKI